MEQGKRRAAAWAFALYCGVMLWLLFARSGGVAGVDYWEQVRMNLNLEPLHTIRLFWRVLTGDSSEYYVRLAVVNLFGNVVMFIPLGFFLPVLWQGLRKWWRTWMATLGIMVLVELAQLFTLRGSCDVDDLILNLAGGAMGYGLFCLVRRWMKKE